MKNEKYKNIKESPNWNRKNFLSPESPSFYISYLFLFKLHVSSDNTEIFIIFLSLRTRKEKLEN